MADEDGTALAGTFWFDGGPRRNGEMVSTDSKTRVVTEGLVKNPATFTFNVGEGLFSMSYSGDPQDIVEDSKPQALLGRLDDDRDVTLLDSGLVDVVFPNRQVIDGARLYVGGHIASLSSPLIAARISLAHHGHWVQLSRPSSQSVSMYEFEGTLRIYEDGGLYWIELRSDDGLSDREWERRFWYRVLILLSAWSGMQVTAVKVQVKVADESPWCDLQLRETKKADPPSGQDTMLLPSALSVEMLAQALVKFEDWGAIAEKASQRLAYQVPLQFAVIGYAAALEGLHRRCFKKTKPFSKLSKKTADQVAAAAAQAAVTEATKLGEKAATVDAFKEAFRYFNEPTFAARIEELIRPLLDIAPGLFGNDLAFWIDQLKRARNGEAHQLVQVPGLDHAGEIDNLYQLAVSSEWALRLCVLLQLGVDAGELRAGLRRFRRFEFVLANLDKCEFSWPGSRLGTFRAAM